MSSKKSVLNDSMEDFEPSSYKLRYPKKSVVSESSSRKNVKTRGKLSKKNQTPKLARKSVRNLSRKSRKCSQSSSKEKNDEQQPSLSSYLVHSDAELVAHSSGSTCMTICELATQLSGSTGKQHNLETRVYGPPSVEVDLKIGKLATKSPTFVEGMNEISDDDFKRDDNDVMVLNESEYQRKNEEDADERQEFISEEDLIALEKSVCQENERLCPACKSIVSTHELNSHLSSCLKKYSYSGRSLRGGGSGNRQSEAELTTHSTNFVSSSATSSGASTTAAGSSKRGRSRKKGANSDDIHMACALSRSLLEAEKTKRELKENSLLSLGLQDVIVEERRLNPMPKPPPGTNWWENLPKRRGLKKGKKQTKRIYPLITCTEEERKAIVEKKVELILSQYRAPPTHVDPKFLHPPVTNEVGYLWRMAGSSLEHPLSDHFVSEIKQFIPPLAIPVGTLFRSLSQIPGRLNYTLMAEEEMNQQEMECKDSCLEKSVVNQYCTQLILAELIDSQCSLLDFSSHSNVQNPKDDTSESPSKDYILNDGLNNSAVEENNIGDGVVHKEEEFISKDNIFSRDMERNYLESESDSCNEKIISKDRGIASHGSFLDNKNVFENEGIISGDREVIADNNSITFNNTKIPLLGNEDISHCSEGVFNDDGISPPQDNRISSIEKEVIFMDRETSSHNCTVLNLNDQFISESSELGKSKLPNLRTVIDRIPQDLSLSKLTSERLSQSLPRELFSEEKGPRNLPVKMSTKEKLSQDVPVRKVSGEKKYENLAINELSKSNLTVKSCSKRRLQDSHLSNFNENAIKIPRLSFLKPQTILPLSSKFSLDWKRLLDSKDHSDVIIITTSKPIYVHTLVLFTRLPDILSEIIDDCPNDFPWHTVFENRIKYEVKKASLYCDDSSKINEGTLGNSFKEFKFINWFSISYELAYLFFLYIYSGYCSIDSKEDSMWMGLYELSLKYKCSDLVEYLEHVYNSSSAISEEAYNGRKYLREKKCEAGENDSSLHSSLSMEDSQPLSESNAKFYINFEDIGKAKCNALKASSNEIIDDPRETSSQIFKHKPDVGKIEIEEYAANSTDVNKFSRSRCGRERIDLPANNISRPSKEMSCAKDLDVLGSQYESDSQNEQIINLSGSSVGINELNESLDFNRESPRSSPDIFDDDEWDPDFSKPIIDIPLREDEVKDSTLFKDEMVRSPLKSRDSLLWKEMIGSPVRSQDLVTTECDLIESPLKNQDSFSSEQREESPLESQDSVSMGQKLVESPVSCQDLIQIEEEMIASPSRSQSSISMKHSPLEQAPSPLLIQIENDRLKSSPQFIHLEDESRSPLPLNQSEHESSSSSTSSIQLDKNESPRSSSSTSCLGRESIKIRPELPILEGIHSSKFNHDDKTNRFMNPSNQEIVELTTNSDEDDVVLPLYERITQRTKILRNSIIEDKFFNQADYQFSCSNKSKIVETVLNSDEVNSKNDNRNISNRVDSSKIVAATQWSDSLVHGCNKTSDVVKLDCSKSSQLTGTSKNTHRKNTLKRLKNDDISSTSKRTPLKGYTCDDNVDITPFPDYKSMASPDLRHALDRFGIRKLSRRKAVTLLTHIYEQTHPLIDSPLSHGLSSQPPGPNMASIKNFHPLSQPVRKLSSKTLQCRGRPVTSKRSLSPCSSTTRDDLSDQPVRSFGSFSSSAFQSRSQTATTEHLFSHCSSSYRDGFLTQPVNRSKQSILSCSPTSEGGFLSQPVGKSKRRPLSSFSSTSRDCSQDCSSNELNSSFESDFNCLEESLFLLSAENDDVITASQLVSLDSQLTSCIQGDEALYKRVLLYEPIFLDEFKRASKEAGVKCGQAKLIKFLDEKCITFRLPLNGRMRGKKKKIKRKN